MVEGFLEATVDALGTAVASFVSPAWIVAAAGIGACLLAFHAVLGSAPGRWLRDLPFATGGFALGNFVGYASGWPTPVVGDVHPVEAALGTWLVLGALAVGGALAPAVPAVILRRARLR